MRSKHQSLLRFWFSCFITEKIGNPLNDGSWTYEWAVGRQLKKMSRDGQSLTFKYDHNGMRIQKVHEHSWYPETTNYTYHGKLLTHMEVNYTDFDEVEHTDKLHFFYDAQSRPAKVRFNGTIYTYVQNLQCDIVGILDNGGNLVVEYKYDAWGKLLSTTGSLADTLGIRNPFRYRGYIFDEETKLYYLSTRYYSPERMRFMSADTYMGEARKNLYAYTNNQVVGVFDYSGKKTYAIGVTESIIGGLGLTSTSVGICWDDKGGRGTFVTYAGIEGYADKRVEENIVTMGQFSIGAVAFFQYTSLESIEDLDGPGVSMGTSISHLGLDAVFAYPEEEGDYDLLGTYPVGFQTSLGVSWGVDFAHIIKSYTIVTRLDSRNYSLLGRSKNRYTVRSSASKFRVEMDR